MYMPFPPPIFTYNISVTVVEIIVFLKGKVSSSLSEGSMDSQSTCGVCGPVLSWEAGEVSYFFRFCSVVSHLILFVHAPFKHFTMAMSHGRHQRIPPLLRESNASRQGRGGLQISCCDLFIQIHNINVNVKGQQFSFLSLLFGI